MIRALYSAASGMIAQTAKQDVIANNIANAQTPGFKRLRVVNTSFSEALNNAASAMVTETTARPVYPSSPVQALGVQAETANDTDDGPILSTGSLLQFAIQGPGTFEVGSGDTARQTRNGSFIIDKDGELANSDGEKVQGRSGAIKMPLEKWSVSDDGSIVNARGEQLDQIKIDGAEQGSTHVMQGYIEQSNVSVIREMVDMIANLRAFEANQKVVQSVDQTLDKLINEAGKV
jgi:flagellar basal-body rod protein FlgF